MSHWPSTRTYTVRCHHTRVVAIRIPVEKKGMAECALNGILAIVRTQMSYSYQCSRLILLAGGLQSRPPRLYPPL